MALSDDLTTIADAAKAALDDPDTNLRDALTVTRRMVQAAALQVALIEDVVRGAIDVRVAIKSAGGVEGHIASSPRLRAMQAQMEPLVVSRGSLSVEGGSE